MLRLRSFRIELAATLAVACLLAFAQARALDADAIDKQVADKMAQARKAYVDALNANADDAIRKYEALLKQESAAGRTASAQEIARKIDALKDLKADPFASPEDGTEAPEDVVPASTPNAKVRSELRKRMRAFYMLLAKEDYEAAKAYLDPKIAQAPPEAVQGALKIMSGHLTAASIKKESQIDLKDLTLNPQRNGAKATPRWQNAAGDWGDGQPQYWTLAGGKWRLGDEKELKKFK